MKLSAKRRIWIRQRRSLSLVGILLFVSTRAVSTSWVMAQDLPKNLPNNKEAPGSKPHEQAKAAGKKSQENGERENKLGAQALRNILRDQREIWTSPAHLGFGHADWLIPFTGITAGFLVTDRDASLHLSDSPKTLNNYTDFSNYGIVAMAGTVGGLYLWGRATHDEHKREAGILSGEAAVNGLIVTTTLKYATGRERPDVDSARGEFWKSGTSFPSGHATAAWAVASVISHEYPGPLTKVFAYGAATAITVARVQGKNHFPADAFLGSGIGWLAGWQAYRAHHNPELGGGIAERLSGSPLLETERTPSAMGSPYVPLDSWIYPILDRLVALGAIDDAILGMKPWTRLECARLVSEVGDRLEDGTPGTEAERLYESVRQEFLPEIALLGGGSNRAAHLESVYTRVTQISGPPLTDGYHFGQTLINDFGRPYEKGFNSVTGFSGWATAGRWAVYLRGEYQHAPAGSPVSSRAESVIAAVDGNPVLPSNPAPSRNQARLLDTYVGLNLGNWEISYGQESQWWAPNESGPLLYSDNGFPVRMFRINRVSPFRLPGPFKFLGPTRWDAFFGTLQGHQTSPGPFMHGEKISFKPTRNVEFGFTRTVILGGAGLPITPDRLLRSYFSATSVNNETPATDPGKRTGGFDFSYRVPFLRKWLTIYTDSLADDDPSPLAAPRRAGVNPGMYVSHFPGLEKLDLQVEAPLTNTVSTNGAGRYIYWDGFYHDLYTNRGNLIGNWVGRDGAGILATSRYWLTARDSIQWRYRHAKVDTKFIPQGGTINDGSICAEFWMKHDWETSALIQYEQWRFPVLATGLQRNVTASVQLSYWPAR